jgi:hypothetical protein
MGILRHKQVQPVTHHAFSGGGELGMGLARFWELNFPLWQFSCYSPPPLASVWVPGTCESGGLVGMVNTNLEKNARQDQVTSIARATVARGDGR